MDRDLQLRLVAKNPGLVCLFLHRALGEGVHAFQHGVMAPKDLQVAMLGAAQVLSEYLVTGEVQAKPYHQFVKDLVDSGTIELGGLGHMDDGPVDMQRPETLQ